MNRRSTFFSHLLSSGLFLVFFALLIVFTIPVCSKKTTEPKPPSAEAQVIEGERTFAFEFLKAVNQVTVDSNLLCTPFAEALNFGQYWLGMGDEAGAEMAKAFHVDTMSREQFNTVVAGLVDKMKSGGTSFDFHGKLFDCLDGRSYREEFMAQCSTLLKIGVVRFDCMSSSADTAIGQWLQDNSNGYYTIADWELADTTGYIYFINFYPFDAEWSIPFELATVRSATFPSTSGELSPCSLMTAVGEYNVWQNPTFSAINVTYTDSTFVTTFILPADSINLNDMITDFTIEDWNAIQPKLTQQSVSLTIPKWSHDFERQDIIPGLKQLGVNRIFSASTGNFPDMLNGNIQIYLSVYNSFGWLRLLPDSMGNMARKPMEPSLHLIFDRPFISVLWHKPTGLILQINKIERPPEN